MATELEIKLSVSEHAQEQAVQWLVGRTGVHSGKTMDLVNRYFDTPGGVLNRSKAALRIRKAGDAFIQTLKTRGEFVNGAHAREEWEWPLAGPDLDLDRLADTPLHRTLDLSELGVVFETNFQRRIFWLQQGAATIEVAVDSGVVKAGDKRLPLNEIEFELTSGAPESLVNAALALADEVPVFLNLVSKAEQGYWLGGLYHPQLEAGHERLSVTAYLKTLGHGWLLEKPVPIQMLDLSRVAGAADAAGCSELWRQVNDELSRGVLVREFAERATLLGRLQLQLAAAGQV